MRRAHEICARAPDHCSEGPNDREHPGWRKHVGSIRRNAGQNQKDRLSDRPAQSMHEAQPHQSAFVAPKSSATRGFCVTNKMDGPLFDPRASLLFVTRKSSGAVEFRRNKDCHWEGSRQRAVGKPAPINSAKDSPMCPFRGVSIWQHTLYGGPHYRSQVSRSQCSQGGHLSCCQQLSPAPCRRIDV